MTVLARHQEPQVEVRLVLRPDGRFALTHFRAGRHVHTETLLDLGEAYQAYRKAVASVGTRAV